MAGIGFILRKLAGEDNLSGFIRAYCHSVIVAVGPWLMIVISIASLLTLSSSVLSSQELNEFLAIFIYNLCFSFILTGPLYMISARYVSDCLYLRSLFPIPGILITTLYILFVFAIPIGTLFYVFYTNMAPLIAILSIANFLLLCQTWITMLFLGLLRDFRAITFSWVISSLVTIVLTLYLGQFYGVEGVLLGLNIGLSVLAASLTANVLAEYPYPFQKAANFSFYFYYYNGLFWSGLCFFSSMWIDKIIMWASPESIMHLNHLRTYPIYDGAMFLSYLTIVPVMALFIFDLETNFYDSYIQYIDYIENNAPLHLIENEKKSIVSKVYESARSFLVFQGSISIIVVLFAPQIFAFIGIDFMQLSIFRLGTIGAFFSTLNFFIVILFSYFDSQENMLKVTGMMLASNFLMTLMSLYLGFPYYGYGFCLSMIFSFLVAAMLLVKFLNHLTYHIFITNNVKRQNVRERYYQHPGVLNGK